MMVGTAELDHLESLFQPWCFYDSVILFYSSTKLKEIMVTPASMVEVVNLTRII